MQGKVRLDAYLASQLPDASRAKISASIKAGLIVINKAVVSKPSYAVKAGDAITAALLPPEPCTVRLRASLRILYYSSTEQLLEVVRRIIGRLV
jgi:predicted rRNA methylase YqxC with S4 and FtsJ domains